MPNNTHPPVGACALHSPLKNALCTGLAMLAAVLALPAAPALANTAASATAAAPTYVRSGKPCVAELCLGDGLSALRELAWVRATSANGRASQPQFIDQRTTSAAAFQALGLIYRGDWAGATPYLATGKFDAGALSSLAAVRGACAAHALVGTYTSPQGNLTEVRLAFVADPANANRQRWSVVQIRRAVAQASTVVQKAEVAALLAKRYAAFDYRTQGPAKPGDARMTIFDDAVLNRYGFDLWIDQGGDPVAPLKRHPVCNPDAPAAWSID